MPMPASGEPTSYFRPLSLLASLMSATDRGPIRTVAITPSKSKMYDFAEVRRICHTSTIAGFQAMIDSELAKPFRFVYMSGAGIDRDQAKQPSPSFMAPYMLMRVSGLACQLESTQI